MRFVDEYRDADATAAVAREIRAAITRPHVIMEVCGGQTHSILRYGLDRLLPPEDELVHSNAALETGGNLAILAGTLLAGFMMSRQEGPVPAGRARANGSGRRRSRRTGTCRVCV